MIVKPVIGRVVLVTVATDRALGTARAGTADPPPGLEVRT